MQTMASYQGYAKDILYRIIGSKDKTDHPQECLIIASIFYWSFTLLLARGLRLLTNTLTLSKYANQSMFIATAFHYFICAFELTACSLERAFLVKPYGFQSYLMCLFIFGVIFWLTFDRASGNPCQVLRQYLCGNLPVLHACTLILMQVTGSAIAFLYARTWWSMGATVSHRARYDAVLSLPCTTHLQVPLLLGCFVEFCGTLLDAVYAAFSNILFVTDDKGDLPVFHILLGLGITWSGLELTGMYCNPANAMAQTYGCSGASPLDYLFVYWTSPFLAVFIGHQVSNSLISFQSFSVSAMSVMSSYFTESAVISTLPCTSSATLNSEYSDLFNSKCSSCDESLDFCDQNCKKTN